jgi:hypothetical protein
VSDLRDRSLDVRPAWTRWVAPVLSVITLALAPSAGFAQQATGRVWNGEVRPDPQWVQRLGLASSFPIQFVIDDADRATGRIRIPDRDPKGKGADGTLTGSDGSGLVMLSSTLEGDPSLPADVRAQATVKISLGGQERDGKITGNGTINMIDLSCVVAQATGAALSLGGGGKSKPCERVNIPATWTATGSSAAGAIEANERPIPQDGKPHILKVSGDVEILRAGKSGAPEEAGKGMAIGPGDRIVTGMESTISVEMPDGHVVTVNELTDVKLDELQGGPDSVRTRLWLKAGEISAELLHKTQTRSDFSVKTPTATLGVRGTAFSVRHTEKPAPQTLVKVTSGSIEVTPNDPTAGVAMVGAGGEARIDEHRLTYTGNVQTTARTAGPPPGPAAPQTAPQAAATTPPAGAPKFFYGALAYGAGSTAFGYAFGKDTAKDADATALSNCRQGQGGDDCKIVADFSNSCAAVAAIGSTGVFEVGHGGTRDLAQAEAMRACSRRGGGCEIKVWTCTGP